MPMQVIEGYMKYVPSVHTGTPEEVIDGLLNEAESISTDGFMRMHAQCREVERIRLALRQLGVDLIEGDKEDKGWILAVRMPHEPSCKVDETEYCTCTPFRRFRSCF